MPPGIEALGHIVGLNRKSFQGIAIEGIDERFHGCGGDAMRFAHLLHYEHMPPGRMPFGPVRISFQAKLGLWRGKVCYRLLHFLVEHPCFFSRKLRYDQAVKTERFYNELLEWISAKVSKEEHGYLMGVNGPQGCGKTTLTKALCGLFEKRGKRCLTISIDDFYLTRNEQVQLASEHSDNPFLQQRGYPGTHDIELGSRVLRSLKNGNMSVAIPRYDKSLHGAKGDRLPESEWTQVDGVVDLVFVEGWMLGFTPVEQKQLPNEHFREINQLLDGYSAWHRQLDGFLQLAPENFRYVIDWRIEAEQRMRAEGREGMSDAEIRAYVEKFLPAYDTSLPQLEKNPPVIRNRQRIVIGKDRLPVSQL